MAMPPPHGMDWLAWGIALTELTTTRQQQSHPSATLMRRRPPPAIHRAPLPPPLPNNNEDNDIQAPVSSSTASLLAVSTALRFLVALSESPRLRLELKDQYVQALRTVVSILSRTLVKRTPAGPVERSHETLDLQDSAQRLNEEKENITMTLEESNGLCAMRLDDVERNMLALIEKLKKDISVARHRVLSKQNAAAKARKKVQKTCERLMMWRLPMHETDEENTAMSWDVSVLEREIHTAKLAMRKKQAQRIKLEREKIYFLPEADLQEAKTELKEVQELVELSKESYKRDLASSCEAQALATQRERKTASLRRDSARLRQEHLEWPRNNTPRPDIGELLPEGTLPKFKTSAHENASIAERLAALELKFERRLKEMSKDVRRAYQQDDGVDEVDENGNPTQSSQHKMKSNIGEVYDDALGGLASWTLRMAFLRLRVAIDGAVAKMSRHRHTTGFHRSEKMIQLGTNYVEEEDIKNEGEKRKRGKQQVDKQVDKQVKKPRQVCLKSLASSQPILSISSNEYSLAAVAGGAMLTQLTTNSIAQRMAALVKTLKISVAVQKSTEVRTEILQSATLLRTRMREFDAALAARESDATMKGMVKKKSHKDENHIDIVLSHLRLHDVCKVDFWTVKKVITLADIFREWCLVTDNSKEERERLQAGDMDKNEKAAFVPPADGTFVVYGLGGDDRTPIFLRTKKLSTKISGVRRMDRHEVRTILDQLWAARLGAVSSTGGMKNSRMFVDASSRSKRNNSVGLDVFLQDFFASRAVDDGTTAAAATATNSLTEAYSLWWSIQWICDGREEKYPTDAGISFIRM